MKLQQLLQDKISEALGIVRKLIKLTILSKKLILKLIVEINLQAQPLQMFKQYTFQLED